MFHCLCVVRFGLGVRSGNRSTKANVISEVQLKKHCCFLRLIPPAAKPLLAKASGWVGCFCEPNLLHFSQRLHHTIVHRCKHRGSNPRF